jgi:hypothetical protein
VFIDRVGPQAWLDQGGQPGGGLDALIHPGNLCPNALSLCPIVIDIGYHASRDVIVVFILHCVYILICNHIGREAFGHIILGGGVMVVRIHTVQRFEYRTIVRQVFQTIDIDFDGGVARIESFEGKQVVQYNLSTNPERPPGTELLIQCVLGIGLYDNDVEFSR